MKKITVLLFMLLMVASTAFASSQSDRWASINVLDKGFALYYDKDTINYDSDSHMLSSWVRIDISEEARGKYKKENKDIAKELHKVIFNTKDNTVTIDSEYYGYNDAGKRITEGKEEKVNAVVPGSFWDDLYNLVYDCYSTNNLSKNNGQVSPDDLMKSAF